MGQSVVTWVDFLYQFHTFSIRFFKSARKRWFNWKKALAFKWISIWINWSIDKHLLAQKKKEFTRSKIIKQLNIFFIWLDWIFHFTEKNRIKIALPIKVQPAMCIQSIGCVYFFPFHFFFFYFIDCDYFPVVLGFICEYLFCVQ